MQFKTILGLFALAGLGAAMPADGDTLVERSNPPPGQNFCCSGIVVDSIVGLGCNYAQGQQWGPQCPSYCKHPLNCKNGAIVFPPDVRISTYFTYILEILTGLPGQKLLCRLRQKQVIVDINPTYLLFPLYSLTLPD
jgi:hypothetical protein